nr:PREDICTED: zinc finger protein 511 [Lepisosteus oculatus]XP_015201959.1 PREDICTED: zinc finger protein 511 [Lepisosteus oculatus]XP_015201960.1 PREDICTED: zinc finger protein 511 [Lepisosteus oculatus]XP_015201961.1 PREDICTED: zinc finger protein 511 [Lepisosteus oculatus]
MLPLELIRFLTAAGTSSTDIQAIPVLPVQRIAEEPSAVQQVSGDGENVCSSPFDFTPQRIRLNKDHELFEDGDIQRHLYLQDAATSVAEATDRPKVSEFQCHIAGCRELFDTLEGYEHHYNALHRNVCGHCRRSFPSGRLLDIHIPEWHDALFQVLAERQNMYQCLVEGCDVKLKTSGERKDHLIKKHSYPPDFRFDKPKKSKSKAQEKPCWQKGASMDVCEAAAVQLREPERAEPMEFSPSGNTAPAGRASGTADDSRAEQTKPRYSYKVPPSVCFGQGSVRGFRGTRRKK